MLTNLPSKPLKVFISEASSPFHLMYPMTGSYPWRLYLAGLELSTCIEALPITPFTSSSSFPLICQHHIHRTFLSHALDYWIFRTIRFYGNCKSSYLFHSTDIKKDPPYQQEDGMRIRMSC